MNSISSEAIAVQPFDIKAWFAGRTPFRQAFLQQHGWASAHLSPVGEDCAYRRYYRLSMNDKTAILMEALPDHHDIATPGHHIRDFIHLGLWLRLKGIHVPEIYEADASSGYALLEDFGDMSFKSALQQGMDPSELYTLATDVLVKLSALKDLPDLPSYRGSHVDYGQRRIVDWYMPVVRGQANADGLWQDYMSVWKGIEAGLPECPDGFLHIDYHAENLMWLPDNKDIFRCGVLDFQGAMKGPVAYDLANLLEDPRQDIAPDLRSAMFNRFTQDMNKADQESFTAWYRILATQFHCRVIGQFIKLALTASKPRYLQFVPRLEAYLQEGLEDPLLAPLKEWFTENGLIFSASIDDIYPKQVELIAADAF